MALFFWTLVPVGAPGGPALARSLSNLMLYQRVINQWIAFAVGSECFRSSCRPLNPHSVALVVPSSKTCRTLSSTSASCSRASYRYLICSLWICFRQFSQVWFQIMHDIPWPEGWLSQTFVHSPPRPLLHLHPVQLRKARQKYCNVSWRTSDKPNFNSFLEVSIFKQVTLKLVTLPFTTTYSLPLLSVIISSVIHVPLPILIGQQASPSSPSLGPRISWNKLQWISVLWPNFQWFIVFLFEKNIVGWLKLNQPIWKNIMMRKSNWIISLTGMKMP